MKKNISILLIVVLISAITVVFFVYEIKIDRRPLKDRIIEEEKRLISYIPYPQNKAQEKTKEDAKLFVKNLENMNIVDPPFIIRNASFSILKGGEGEYMGWTVNWREDGFVTKGIRLRYDSRLSSEIIKEIPFPEDKWNRDIQHPLKTTTIRILSCKIVPQKETKWIDSVTYGTVFPMDFFENPIYITLYDSQGRECEPILCEKIKELIGKHHTAELTEPNVKLWSEIKGSSN